MVDTTIIYKSYIGLVSICFDRVAVGLTHVHKSIIDGSSISRSQSREYLIDSKMSEY